MSEQATLQDHFAHCIQVFGGIPATSRRLGIDERSLRRFINGEKEISERLLSDTVQALRVLIAEAGEAERAVLGALAGKL